MYLFLHFKTEASNNPRILLPRYPQGVRPQELGDPPEDDRAARHLPALPRLRPLHRARQGVHQRRRRSHDSWGPSAGVLQLGVEKRRRRRDTRYPYELLIN